MATTPEQATDAPLSPAATDGLSAASDDPSAIAHGDYIHDQLQQARTVLDHGTLLQRHARTRVAAAKSALARQGHTLGVTATPADALGQYHVVARMLDERAFYPAHDARKESPDYARIHHQMTVVDDKHCLVCGVQHSTLADPARNPFGAIQMETHHHTIEWALANAVDPAKFNQHIRPGLLHQAQRRAQEAGYAQVDALYKVFDAIYANDMDEATIKAWVDHAADNLWVLCDVHHRHKFVGIHAITYPIWGPQDVVDAGLIARQIALAKGDPGAV